MTTGEVVAKGEFLAVLRMLVDRATLLDRWAAYARPGHWLNRARRDLLSYKPITADDLPEIMAKMNAGKANELEDDPR